jgi:predicted ATPase/DNA-binding XRE family transcriptional regulator
LAEVSFGEWLKRRRGAEGWTQGQLAQKINCSLSALRKMESEERRPSTQIVEQLAEIFNIPQEEHKAFLRFTRGDWQAISSGDQEEAPWLVSRVRPAPRSNLPASTTSFIGREREQKEIIDLIANNRLVTLTGAGGIGKTRLSIQVASGLLNGFPNGIWLIELAPLSDPALLPEAMVSTLGLIDQAGRSALNVLTDFLQSKRVLLLIDNCEHLIQACAQTAETLLQSCPNLHILATSREALGITGETIYLVPSLTTPDPLKSTLDILLQYEAVRLFVERSQSTIHDFSLTESNASAIAQICHHLDGIPLALELAAARVKLLRVEEITARLHDRFRLLTGGSRTALPRHQTLQALIDWSHDLLSENERLLLRHLSVFAGGWTLEATESVCGDEHIQKHEMLDLLTQLVNKSLILAERKQDQETRYHMLETIRQYAREKLWKAGEGELLRERHLAYFVNLAERAEPNLRAFDMVMWLDLLETELDNIRVALEYALESDIEAELRLASALQWFWHIRGHRNEGIDWLERGLSIETMERGDQPLTPGRAMIRGKALNVSGIQMTMFFDYGKATLRLEESLSLFQRLGSGGKQGMAYALMRLGSLSTRDRSLSEQSLTLFREVGDKFGIAECLMMLAGQATSDNNYNRLKLLAEDQLALRREIGDKDGIASALGDLGELALWQDDYQFSIILHEESLTCFREVGDKWATSFILSVYGSVFLWQGDYEQAAQKYEDALAFAQALSDRSFIAYNSFSLGTIAWLKGDYPRATQMIHDSVEVFRDVGQRWLGASGLHTLGDIALAQGDNEKAAKFYNAAQDLSREEQFRMGVIFAMGGLSKVAYVKGDYAVAIKGFDEELGMSQDANLKLATFQAFCGLGRVAQLQTRYDDARTYYRKALEIYQQRINHPLKWIWLKPYAAVSYPLGAFATLAIARNQMGQAARLLGAMEPTYPVIQYQQTPAERAEHDQAIAAARAALGEEAFATAYEEGKKMTLDEAVAFALGDTEANVG